MSKKALGSMIIQHFHSLDAILNAFGYEPKWHEYPLEDARDRHWMMADRGDRVVWSDKPLTRESVEAGRDIYSGDVLNDGEELHAEGLVMLAVDTGSDGNAYLMIFDASKKCEDAELIELW